MPSWNPLHVFKCRNLLEFLVNVFLQNSHVKLEPVSIPTVQSSAFWCNFFNFVCTTVQFCATFVMLSPILAFFLLKKMVLIYPCTRILTMFFTSSSGISFNFGLHGNFLFKWFIKCVLLLLEKPQRKHM